MGYIHFKIFAGRIDKEIEQQYQTQSNYWVDVIKRIVVTISFLAERGLGFRGSDERFNSVHNGNYLGLLEVIANFDPFLSHHIEEKGDLGSGNTSYLSKTIAEEFIDIMGKKLLDTIVSEINQARYFPISVGSTPDIAHLDQLTIILRYVNLSTHEPVERFMTFIQIVGHHTGENMAEILLNFLNLNGVNIAHCRGQTYDNACNMSGKYSGMQKHIKDVIPQADYIPCAAHSLNLVGHAAVNCCIPAVSFFGIIQKIYTFFSVSTSRWAILSEALKGSKSNVPKRLADTRWSAHVDATNALHNGYAFIRKALWTIADDTNQKAEARHEAQCIAESMNQLEIGIMCVVWDNILERFNKCSKSLQSASIDLSTAIALMKSLQKFLNKFREQFEKYERVGMELTDCDTYTLDKRRARRPTRTFEEDREENTPVRMSASEKFKLDTFFVIIDKLSTALELRINAYSKVHQSFGFLTEFHNMDHGQIDDAILNLVLFYPADFDSAFCTEFHQFTTFISEQENLITHEQHPSQLNYREVQNMYTLVKSSRLDSAFPNVEVALRI